MKSYSQAGQDLFTDAVLRGKRNGAFLDIGACHPVQLSNTYALETERGWTGLLCDLDPGACKLLLAQREAEVIEGDATQVDWLTELEGAKRIDYLSLDVDGATLSVLQKLPLESVRFSVATIETDFYRFGPGPRDAMREIMVSAGYFCVCSDVQSSDGLPYEDWWVDPEIVPKNQYGRFLCSNTPWPQIISRV
jgi:hypothetical protein